MELPVYLDHAATTPLAPEVVESMLPYFTQYYGNASALHSLGCAARDAVEGARDTVASALNASPEEIVFTSGGTESDNAALRGAVEAPGARGRHILCSAIEHHAVLEPLEALAKRGEACLELIPVAPDGRVDPEDVRRRIRPDTLLVSVMHANNEIGTIQPIAEIGAICREHGVLFHTDTVQTAGKLPIDVRAMSIDLLSISAHKFYGPKGCGALFVRRGVRIARYQEGGEQERGRRGGTLNVPGIVGLGSALKGALLDMAPEAARLSHMRDHLIATIESRIDGVHVTGSREFRLPMNVHLCIDGVQGESILLTLDAAGICASAGSACTAGATEPSHVLKAVGVERELALGALRLTLGRSTDVDALDYAAETLARAVTDLRKLAG